MAGPLLYDRVAETSTTTGTGAFTLLGAKVGYQTFDAALAISDTFPYCIANQGGTEWEVGIGTLSASTTLTRTTVLASSNSGSAVNFSAGTKDVFLTYPAGRAILKTGALTSNRVPYVSSNGELTDSADFTFNGAAINLGTTAPTIATYKGAVVDAGSATNAVQSVFAIGYNSTGTPAAGLGSSLRFLAESSTTENQLQASIEASWQTATHATRASELAFYTYSASTAQEGFRIRAALSVQIGFFGVTPTSRPGATDDIKDALTNLGLLQGTSATPLNMDGGKLTCGEAEIDGALNHDGSTAGFFNVTPVNQQATTGTTSGFVAGASTPVRVDSTFTGNTGSAAYTLGDVVLALKNLGFLAA